MYGQGEYLGLERKIAHARFFLQETMEANTYHLATCDQKEVLFEKTTVVSFLLFLVSYLQKKRYRIHGLQDIQDYL